MLTNQEQVHSTNECEALGQKFTLITDHQALVSILAQSSSRCKAHKFDRWHARLAEFDYDFQHKPGSDNIIPSMLSQLPQPPPTKVNSIVAENLLLKT
uniref:Reverse transcriptase RNase H-like domain-containing protein n=1 Tax=Romanomermis culicivorax TaxID=13658 RepID=A0A915IUW0_ROMCU